MELKSPPTLVREEEELRRTDDGKERTLEVIAEIPEDVNTAFGNGQQNVEESSPVQLVTEGNRIITSIAQTLDQVAKFPMREDLPPSQLNARSQANVSDDKQADANSTHQVDTYFANPAAPYDVTVRPGVNSLVGTSLITPLEQNDKEMPKTRRSQSVGQFPSTPSKHKFGNGNSKSLPPSRHKSSPPKDMVRKPSKGGKDSSILSDFFLPKGGKAPAAKYPFQI